MQTPTKLQLAKLKEILHLLIVQSTNKAMAGISKAVFIVP